MEVIMVSSPIFNGVDYIECEKCGAYELYEVSRLRVVRDGYNEWLCRRCMLISRTVAEMVNQMRKAHE